MTVPSRRRAEPRRSSRTTASPSERSPWRSWTPTPSGRRTTISKSGAGPAGPFSSISSAAGSIHSPPSWAAPGTRPGSPACWRTASPCRRCSVELSWVLTLPARSIARSTTPTSRWFPKTATRGSCRSARSPASKRPTSRRPWDWLRPRGTGLPSGCLGVVETSFIMRSQNDVMLRRSCCGRSPVLPSSPTASVSSGRAWQASTPWSSDGPHATGLNAPRPSSARRGEPRLGFVQLLDPDREGVGMPVGMPEDWASFLLVPVGPLVVLEILAGPSAATYVFAGAVQAVNLDLQLLHFRRAALALQGKDAEPHAGNSYRLALRRLEPLRRLRAATRARLVHGEHWAAALAKALGSASAPLAPFNPGGLLRASLRCFDHPVRRRQLPVERPPPRYCPGAGRSFPELPRCCAIPLQVGSIRCSGTNQLLVQP